MAEGEQLLPEFKRLSVGSELFLEHQPPHGQPVLLPDEPLHGRQRGQGEGRPWVVAKILGAELALYEDGLRRHGVSWKRWAVAGEGDVTSFHWRPAGPVAAGPQGSEIGRVDDAARGARPSAAAEGSVRPSPLRPGRG